MNVGGYSARGPREANEDGFFVRDFSDVDAFTDGVVAFAMVSDGMGGYRGGDVASGLAVACAQSYVGQLVEMAQGNKVELDAAAALTEIARNAHEAIVAESAKDATVSMGATFVGAFVSPTHAWIGHIGDSRAYLVRDGMAMQLTEDHSQVGRLLSRGIITEEEAQSHPARNRIERALGFSDGDAEIDEVDLQPGDALVLCSDGVYTVLDAPTLADCITGPRDAESAAKRAVKLALARGTDDNSTAAVVLNSKARGSVGAARRQVASQGMGATIAPDEGVRPAIGGTPQARAQRSDEARPAWSLGVPLVVLVLLVGLLAFFLARAHMQETLLGGTDASGGQVQSPQAPPDDEAGPSEQGEQGQDSAHQTVDSSDMASSIEEGDQAPSDEGSVEHTSGTAGQDAGDSQSVGHQDVEQLAQQDGYEVVLLGQAMELKYIDYNGVAQVFTTEPWLLLGAPYLSGGSSVAVSTQTGAYGRIERAYQQLSDSYLEELRQDLALYIGGANSFDSGLSHLMGQVAYNSLLGGLAEHGSDEFDATVAHLAIDAIEETAAG